jgi:hypothetical protein
MLSHIIVFVILSILSAVAVYAVCMPVSKSYLEHYEPGTHNLHDNDLGALSPV